MLKKTAMQAFIGLVLFTIGCLTASPDSPYVNLEWNRQENHQHGRHSCVARRLGDDSEEVSCKTEVQFRQKSPDEYASKIKNAQEKLDQLKSQFEDCQNENERKDRLIQLQTNLTDAIHRDLSESDIAALESSWTALTADGQNAFGVKFVLWLFSTIPNMRERFIKFNAHWSDESHKRVIPSSTDKSILLLEVFSHWSAISVTQVNFRL